MKKEISRNIILPCQPDIVANTYNGKEEIINIKRFYYKSFNMKEINKIINFFDLDYAKGLDKSDKIDILISH